MRVPTISRFSLQALLTLAIAVVLSHVPATRADTSPEWIAKWTEDLRFAQSQAIETHANLFHTMTREEWDDAFGRLIARLPTLEPHEIAVELAAIITRVGDGHTRLTFPLAPGVDIAQGHSSTPAPKIDALLFHQFPVRLQIDDNGVFIRETTREHEAILGQRVVRIGSLSIEDAITAITPTIRRDNEMQVRHHLPTHLVLSEILAARGVIKDRAHLTLQLEDNQGQTTTTTLPRVAPDQPLDWIANAASDHLLHMQHRDQKFWFTRIEGTQVLYVQFNEVYNTEEETIREFADRTAAAIATEPIEALILDLRNNRGGDASLSLPLLHAILSSRLNAPGSLYTLVGRTTFSAAMMFALDLEHHTSTLFVGESTGASPNSYGDSRKLLLPNSGLTLRVSTRYHQNDFTDNRPWIRPHLSAPMTMQDLVNGNDPAIEEILSIVRDARRPSEAVSGRWIGTASVGLNTLDLILEFDANGDGRVQLPEVEFEASLDDIAYSAGALSFHVETPWGTIEFKGALGTEWMTGELDLESRRDPFVVRRTK